jgi:hypothetical protein
MMATFDERAATGVPAADLATCCVGCGGGLGWGWVRLEPGAFRLCGVCVEALQDGPTDADVLNAERDAYERGFRDGKVEGLEEAEEDAKAAEKEYRRGYDAGYKARRKARLVDTSAREEPF